jgi:hypothetical protein
LVRRLAGGQETASSSLAGPTHRLTRLLEARTSVRVWTLGPGRTNSWSDADLRRTVEACSTWSEVLERLDLGDTSDTRLYVKGHAVRLGLDLSHLNGFRLDECTETVGQLVPDLSTYLRVAAEPIAVAWFTLRGAHVAVPSTPCAYDLLVTLDSFVV